MKTEKQNKLSLKLLGKILAVVLILLVAMISFGGIYVKDKNSMRNVVPEYKLGMDIYGARNIRIKVSDDTEIKEYDSEGNLITEEHVHDDEEDSHTEVEEPVNAPELLTKENYKAVKDIIIKRLEYMKVSDYLIRCDEESGDISIEVPEDSNTDYIAQYAITKGEFKISDNDTSEVLLLNSDVKKANVQYNTSTNGTTVYLTIEFNKEAKQKLKDISNEYIETTDDEGNEITKEINMTLDDQTIITTYFDEEITDGIIYLSIGTSTDTEEVQSYLKQASNIAVFLNTDPMPLTYDMEVNRFVYSDITENILKTTIITLVAIAVFMAIYMIIKFKSNGLMGVIIDVGFTAILLLALRYGNVTITLSGIATIAIATIIEYIITMLILKEYKKDVSKDIMKKNIKDTLKNISISLIPILIIAIVFSLINWENIASMGMIMFWAILVLVIYNTILISLGMFNNKKVKDKTNTKKNKKSKNTDNAENEGK